MSIEARAGGPLILGRVRPPLPRSLNKVKTALNKFSGNILDLIDLDRTPEARFYEPGKAVWIKNPEAKEVLRQLKEALREQS